MMSEPGNRFLPIDPDEQSRQRWRALPIVLVVAIVALTIIRYWFSSDPYPPGLDGAQWLSYGRALFGGAERSAESTYAPLVPGIAQGLSVVLGPVLGLRVLAVLVLVLLGLAVSLLGVSVLGLTWGSLFAALVLPCTALAEPFYYGGYPQQAAFAFGLLGVAAIARANYARNPSSQLRAFAIGAVFFALASASHLLFGPLLLVTATLVAFTMGMGRVGRRRFVVRITACLLPATVITLLVALSYLRYGYAAPLEVSQRSLPEAWVYATRESPWLWAAIVVGGILSSSVVVVRSQLISSSKNARNTLPTAVIVGFALIVPAAVLIVASGQPRLAPPLLVGGALLLGFTCRTASHAWAPTRLLAPAAWCVLVLWLAGITTGFTGEFAHFYQVLDTSLIAAARSIPPTRAGGVAVAADRRGWPVGWWVEALQVTPVLSGSNPQWLAFPEERTRAEAVATLLASPNGLALRRRAEDAGVAYLLLRKWDWIGWERWIDPTPDAPTVIYDDDETIVFGFVSATS